MSTASEIVRNQDSAVVAAVFARVAEDLAVVFDRRLVIESASAARSPAKSTGQRSIHISFKLGIEIDGAEHHGCMIVPLADAISFACYLKMVPDNALPSRRAERHLDHAAKDAMLEVGNLIGAAVSNTVDVLFDGRVRAMFEGCQGVRAGVAPAFEHAPGVDLLIGRARARLTTFPPFEMQLMLPVLPLLPSP